MTEVKGALLSTRRGLRKFDIKGIRFAELARAGLTPDLEAGGPSPLRSGRDGMYQAW